MLTRMRRLIAPPMFAGDVEKTQAAEVLNAVLLAMLVACVLYGVVAPLTTAIYLRHLGIAGLLVLWLLGMLFLMHRGHLRFASGATIVGIRCMRYWRRDCYDTNLRSHVSRIA